MVAAKNTFKMEQGATFIRTLTLTDDLGTPINLSGYTARMQIRPFVTSSSVILDVTPYIDISPVAGVLTINVPATVTSTLYTLDSVYDLEIESSTNIVTRLLEGSVKLDLNVTR